MKHKILITGITGQDGVFLTEQLLSTKNNIIFGTSREKVNDEFYSKLRYLDKNLDLDRLKILNSNLLNHNEVKDLLKTISPDFIYNMSGPSSVYESLIDPKVEDTIYRIFKNIINGCIESDIFPNFFQSSSSEMFGLNKNQLLDEAEEFIPNSPYAKAKLKIHEEMFNLRNFHDWNMSSGIMFNHESEFRGDNYLFMKIVNYVINIKKNTRPLTLGSLSLKRDWSYAKDIMEGAVIINESEISDNYVLGSGNSYSIKQILEIVFDLFNYKWENFVEINNTLLRNSDPMSRIANIHKVESEHDWSPKTSVEIILNRMVEYKLSLRN